MFYLLRSFKEMLIPGLASLVMLASCTKEENTGSDADKVVVEGYLIEGQPVSVKITRMLAYESSDTTKYLNNLSVVIKQGTFSYALNSVGNGEYFLPAAALPIETGKTYTLEFVYKNKTVSATTSIPAKPENFTTSRSTLKFPSVITGPDDFPNPVECKWRNTTADYYLVSAVSYDANPDPVPTFGVGGGTRPTLRSEPLQSNTYELPVQGFSYLGNHHVILFHVQSDYAALYKNSGTSSLNITNLATTVTNGLGIFTGISADTLNLYLYK